MSSCESAGRRVDPEFAARPSSWGTSSAASLRKLIELKRAAERPKDLSRLAELEALLEKLEGN